jgi:hypothetical protein
LGAAGITILSKDNLDATRQAHPTARVKSSEPLIMCEEKPRVAHLIRAKPSYASYGVITERADTIQIAQAEFVVFELTWTGAGRRVGAAR